MTLPEETPEGTLCEKGYLLGTSLFVLGLVVAVVISQLT